jgi:hypothetical protein
VHVKLTDQQRGLAMAIAMRRNNPKVAAGVPSQRLTDARGELDTHLVGVESEIAVAWLYGADMDAHAGLGGDEGYDLEIAGRKVEVKCRKKQGYTFALMDTGPMRAEAGVLVYECDGGACGLWVRGAAGSGARAFLTLVQPRVHARSVDGRATAGDNVVDTTGLGIKGGERGDDL